MKGLNPTVRRRTATEKCTRKTRNFSGKGQRLYVLGFKVKSLHGFTEWIMKICVYETYFDSRPEI